MQKSPPEDELAAPGDGRRRRWEEHKRARREEFVAAALRAIRAHGDDVSLDDIAAEAGVSKSVLYRHFHDKADVFRAVLDRVASDLFLPRVATALLIQQDDEDLLRAAISSYIGLVVEEPTLYRFVFTHNALGRKGDFVATMEDAIAQALSALMADRLRRTGADSGGAEPWAYGVVGMVQLASHRWVDHPTMSAEALVDYLCALAWQGLSGVLPPESEESG
ncbi:MAG TPA: TetR/AcrR family transcriptional regulator [Mycobacteriales bacterium]|nr:TetR/AcrR family transcriptional regulator [Mycobacteriales bacterium]